MPPVRPLILSSCFASDNGGGGERVLWVAIAALLQPSVPDAQALADAKDLQVLIYTGDVGKSIEDILRNVEVRSLLIPRS